MRQRGFTLMETLVALVIFSLASMALLELYSRSARAKAAHDSLIARTHRAEGLLVELELGRSFEPARRGTDPDGTVWEITMVPAGAQLVRIDITVTDRNGRQAHLQTLRLPAELGMEARR